MLAFLPCVQAALPLLSFIPGASVGTAVFFGTAFDPGGTVLPLVIGAGLGWLSAVLAAKIRSAVGGPAPATPLAASPEVA